jgi:hypothetical protein
MKHRVKTLWAAAILIGLAAQAAAQLATTTVVVRPNPRIGLGVALGKEVFEITNNGTVNQVDFPTFYIPVFIHPHLRVEPEIGYVRNAESLSGLTNTNTVLLAGIGVFLTTWAGPVNLYYGARVDGVWKTIHQEFPAADETKWVDWIWGPALGGEYFFTPHLSLGGEIQFNLIRYDVKTIKDDSVNDPSGSTGHELKRTSLRTKPLVFVRWYFGKGRD